ncbi:MAG: hypothetical protein ACJAWW_002155 [Sulfurimonas sp.]
MAKKHIEAFNPWPGFVDLFASIIMVVLIFMLVLIVNITYYSQFKYKISYTGSVPVEEIISEKLIEVDSEVEIEDKQEEAQKDLESVAGLDLTVVDNNLSRQENLIYDDWMIIKYKKNEIILDQKTIKDVDQFLAKVRDTYPNNYASVYMSEPKNQVSASITKQLALSRTLNIRNLLRKRNYNNSDVLIKLKDKIPETKSIKHAAGYGIILINAKK